MKKELPTIFIIFIAVFVVGYFMFGRTYFDLPKGETVRLSDFEEEPVDEKAIETIGGVETNIPSQPTVKNMTTSREILVTDGVKHTIPVEDIRQGCFGRDCIPSVDDPEFISRKEADKLLPGDTVGIGLVYGGETRFYPFNMLVTREIVNDEIGGKPLAVTYCPLCGTGIVFDRKVGNKVYEFGVSGMLWQSNLLMYNREENEEDISLWSQVLGEAVLGKDTGIKLKIIPSDVVRYSDWATTHNKTTVLNTGRMGDPYNGDYYGVAQHFQPDFSENESPLPPTAYVFGVEINGTFKAYPIDTLAAGVTNDIFAGSKIVITKEDDGVVRFVRAGDTEPLQIVTGFWFSWVAAHPETELFR